MRRVNGKWTQWRGKGWYAGVFPRHRRCRLRLKWTEYYSSKLVLERTCVEFWRLYFFCDERPVQTSKIPTK